MKEMKLLNGAELASYIKVRQAKQVRGLRQADHVIPKLAIIQTKDDPIIDTYIQVKQQYGKDILVEVEVYRIPQTEVMAKIELLNQDEAIYGIIVQLPLEDASQTDAILNSVAPEKDVDGLGGQSLFDPATPTAINWLLTGYNIDLAQKNIVILGDGRLVGAPLARLWKHSGYTVNVLNEETTDIASALKKAKVIVSATGVPGLLKSDMIPIDSVVIDAGVASEDGKKRGDVDPLVYERNDLTITPVRGGVGPLTVAALFDNVIRAARQSVSQ